jgi:hypothetical protein
MNIVTLKILIVNKDISLKINDIEQQRYKISRHTHLHFNTIFKSELWKKMCSKPCYIYFRYNVTNLNIMFKTYNIFNSSINNKTLLANVYLHYNNTILTIDALDTKLDTEINIIINIIIPSIRCSCLRTNNCWYLTQMTQMYDNIPIIGDVITTMIKLSKPNPIFKLCKIDTLADYDKKIKSFKMPLYKEQNRSVYDVILDLYPTQSTYYVLIISEIINFHKTSSYKLNFDKECTRCINRIKGCELNMISKVQLCCPCNIDIIFSDIIKFIGQSDIHLSIKISDFPLYIKQNFNSFPIITSG